MKWSLALAALAASSTEAIRILQTNDDGWAELYLRSFHDALGAAGHDAVVSAPAENQSGTGSNDKEPEPRKTACQYNSCPANSGPVGTNTTDTRLNWVNSYPVTSLKYGLSTFGPQIWNGQAPELIVSGPNVGINAWLGDFFSGTVGAAVYGAKNAGIPSIAFSGKSEGTLAWNTSPVPVRSTFYAQIGTKITNAVIASGVPYLPANIFLNVNFPEVTDSCNSLDDVTYVLTRINIGLFSAPDALHCGTTRLPSEFDVINRKGCYVTVSVGDANDKTTASADKQKAVIDKIGSLFTCI
ncbi:survival protein sure-likephosphatase/nucleotidase-like protein [Microdochium trichocladiopsis]|uniref:Survival protein sure-likephosphatase/nucleotidase-like protein n=1 Tax=Microdochium trichocladiopsis TaxID=1682393 RepID=A0A9P9BLN2_9PEZI|nr:survival protein sure-likephosphatase/nucleotidase-like protein [Microdochium trichocladiopsis]KAH7028778.1 survival protein sure-likephosphatase/nucleotidase-like protein [Microdochium trichocladiopsis]